MHRVIRDAIPAALLLVLGSCVNPEVEAKQWDEIQNVAQTVTDLNNLVSQLQQVVDSLTFVNTRQDTAIKVIADFTGAIVPGYRQD